MGKYYLYRHIRLDKNEPFYIGIGTKYKIGSFKKSMKSEYYRAFCKKGKRRSVIWNRVIAKTEYEVEILLESDDYKFIKQKEIEFITLYGRRDLGTGTLVNLTDGGDGTLRRKSTEEYRKNISNRMSGENNHMYGKTGELSPLFGITKSDSHRSKLSTAASRGKSSRAKKVIDTITKQEWDCIVDAAEFHNININTLRGYLKNPNRNKTNLVYKHPEKRKNDNLKIVENRHIILCNQTGIFFYSIEDACQAFNLKYSTLSAQLKGVYKNQTSLIITKEE